MEPHLPALGVAGTREQSSPPLAAGVAFSRNAWVTRGAAHSGTKSSFVAQPSRPTGLDRPVCCSRLRPVDVSGAGPLYAPWLTVWRQAMSRVIAICPTGGRVQSARHGGPSTPGQRARHPGRHPGLSHAVVSCRPRSNSLYRHGVSICLLESYSCRTAARRGHAHRCSETLYRCHAPSRS
jgi:hypothetical protein